MKKREWVNLPNLLTTLRILLVPAFLWAFLQDTPEYRQLSMGFFLAAGLTDCLDGYCARKLNQITKLGKILDPIADKLLTAAVVFCLVHLGVIPLFVLLMIVVKELYMGFGAAVCLKRNIEVQSDIYGKLATVMFYPSVLTAWPWHGVAWLSACGQVLMYVSVALSMLAAVHYTRDSVKKWNAIKAHRNAH